MPSNTDDGIVEKVAAALAKAVGGNYAEYDERTKMAERWKARAAITAYESHLRDKGMVVVDPTTFKISVEGAGGGKSHSATKSE